MTATAQKRERVVVTGLGVVSCLGVGVEEFWRNLLAGRSGIGEITTVRVEGGRCRMAGEVKGFDFAGLTGRAASLVPGRTSQFAAAAAHAALADAGLLDEGSQIRRADPRRVGVVVGTTTGEQQFLEEVIEGHLRGGVESRAGAGQLSCGVIAANVADLFGLGGYAVVLPAACSGGNYAIAHACDLIRAGRLDAALAGAADCLSKHFLYGFARLGALAPERCQPFERNRKGIIPGEGAGMLLLESRASALARGARIYSEVLGYSTGSDAYHCVAPDPEGRGAARAMSEALADAGLAPHAVQYISAHGTGTVLNDLAETRAIKSVFGAHCFGLPVSSVKAMLGHPAGAASALEAVVCNLVIRDRVIPPTINYDEPDPLCDLDYVPNVARRAGVAVAMNNSYAFLGSNASVIFGGASASRHLSGA